VTTNDWVIFAPSRALRPRDFKPAAAPRVIRQKLSIATRYFDETGECLYCTLLNEELAAKKRILVENEHHVALLPYASHVPFEILVVPKRRQSSLMREQVAAAYRLLWASIGIGIC
jgi:galactose-1-phosphate uridylyltransferase